MSGGGDPIVSETPRISALRIQTSCYGGVVPVVIGRQRCTGNLLYYGDLTAIKQEEETGGGGKGGGGGGMTSVWYTYKYDIQWGICEGPVTVGKIWMQDGDQKTRLDQSNYSYAFYPGSTPPSYSTVLDNKHPNNFYRYPGLAHISAVQMGEFSNDSPPSLSFEVYGWCYDGGLEGADPALAVREIITNTRWGAAAPLDRFPLQSAYGDYAVAMGFVLGLEMAEQRTASDWIAAILEQTDAAAVWSGDHLEIIPHADQAVSGNGRTWTPDLTPVYDLTDDDYQGDPEEPVRVSRRADSETYNIQSVEFKNAANEYNIETVDGDDPASVAMYGPKKNSEVLQAHGLLKADAAGRLADLKVRRKLRTRNEFEFELPWTFCRLLPMDIVTLTDPALGLDRYPVRITKIVETEDLMMQVTAEDFPEGAGRAALLPREQGSGYSKDFNSAPGNAATPVIFEPPIALAGAPEVWLATAGGSSWGGAYIWISLDNVTYSMVGRTTGQARMGVTTTSLPLVADPDSTSTLGVNLSISSGTLAGATVAERDAYATLSWVGGELVSYQNAVLTGPNTYALSSLRRGAYGSPVATHASGTPFVRLDAAVFKYAYDPDMLGKMIYIKLQSFNLFGGGVQQLEDLTPVSYTIAGAPLGKVASLALVQDWTGLDCAVKWAAQKGAAQYTIEIWVAGVKRRTVTGIADTRYTYTWLDNLADGGPYRSIELRLYAISANGASTEPAILTATNAQMAVPSGLVITGNGPVLSVMTQKPVMPDYAGTRIWISATSGFNPALVAPVYDGPDWFLESVSQAPGRYYVRVAHYDRFGLDGVNVSSEIVVDYIGAIGGIPQVPDASTIETLAAPSFWAVYDLTTKKIWRWNPATSSYTKAADGGDILASTIAADKLAVAQLSAITADLGDITAGRIHSPSNAVDLDLLAKTLTVKDSMGVERFRAGLLASGEYGAIVRNAAGTKTAALTPDVGTIIASGSLIMPTTLNADGTYEVAISLPAYYQFSDLTVIVDADDVPAYNLQGQFSTIDGWVTGLWGAVHGGGSYKERDDVNAQGRPTYKTHTVNTAAKANAVISTYVMTRWNKGTVTAGSTIYLQGSKNLQAYDRVAGVVKNLIEIGWPIKINYTVIARNYQG